MIFQPAKRQLPDTLRTPKVFTTDADFCHEVRVSRSHLHGLGFALTAHDRRKSSADVNEPKRSGGALSIFVQEPGRVLAANSIWAMKRSAPSAHQAACKRSEITDNSDPSLGQRVVKKNTNAQLLRHAQVATTRHDDGRLPDCRVWLNLKGFTSSYMRCRMARMKI